MSAGDRRAVRPFAFLPIFALANAGGTIAYVPLLTLLVPLQVEAIAPATRIGTLSALTIVGAIVASLGGIGWGIVSDRVYRRSGSRRGVMATGLVLTLASYGAVAAAATPLALVLAIVLFQAAVNMLLAPLSAVMADAVPDEDKGLAGGTVVLAGSAGAIVAAGVAALSGVGEGGQLALVGAIVAACLAPLLVTRTPVVAAPPPAERTIRGWDLVRLSCARLAVQIAGSTLFNYLLYYFETLPGEHGAQGLAARLASLTMAAYLVSTPIGLLVGRWSDRLRRRKPLLLASSVAAAASLVVMAVRANAVSVTAGYAGFILSSTVFLALQTALVMQVLPSPATRARDLGFANLANTGPLLVSATLTWSLVGRYGFPPLFGTLALLVAGGGLLTLSVRSER